MTTENNFILVLVLALEIIRRRMYVMFLILRNHHQRENVPIIDAVNLVENERVLLKVNTTLGQFITHVRKL